ncbi:hypothetical protein [uncultured Pontibacter sp.]|uniref:hypothetical protein n=1 Tax=uncultured Pontibacter sp. TaxID=453356 RepID=UPI0026092217|nr:hypothetical protein [uncultured Pontibacter sp.]
MKKIILSLLTFGCFLAFSEVKAQSTAQSSTSSKDEYWGTSKVKTKGASVDAVGRRGEGMDKRFNEYEEKGSRRKSFEKRQIAKSKKMKEILKKEEEMMKKHKRDKKQLKKRQKRRN